MNIGILAETRAGETRVAVTPETVKKLAAGGRYAILVQSGAGGYGERIASGSALNDNVTLLAGAIPAAALALLIQGAFELVERQFGWMARSQARS